MIIDAKFVEHKIEEGAPVKELPDGYAFVDVMCPAWQDQAFVLSDGGAHCTIYPQSCRERSVILRAGVYVVYGKKIFVPEREFVMPFQMYVRGVDHAGNCCPIITSTARHIDCTQLTGYRDRALAVKRRQNWMIAERSEARDRGFDEAQYGQDLIVAMITRRADHAEHMAREEEQYRSREERAVRETANMQKNTLETLVSGFTAAMEKMQAQNAALMAQLAEKSGRREATK